MLIDVIQEDIDKAIEQRNKYGAKEMLYSPYRHCPIACALTRAGLSFYRVSGICSFGASRFNAPSVSCRIVDRKVRREMGRRSVLIRYWNNHFKWVDFACLPYPVVLWIERFDGKWEGDPFSFDIRERRS